MTAPTVTLERTLVADLLLLLRSHEQSQIGLEAYEAARDMRTYSVDRASALTRATLELRAELEQRIADADAAAVNRPMDRRMG